MHHAARHALTDAILACIRTKGWPMLETIITDPTVHAVCARYGIDARDTVGDILRRLRRDGKIRFVLGTWGIDLRL